MTQRNQVYRCSICGNIVEVLHEGAGQLVCCGQPMQLLEGKTEDMGSEKHMPEIVRTEQGIKVKVGSMPHPMEESHFIEWIDVTVDGRVFRQFLKPGHLPEADFNFGQGAIQARAYCNIHGLWKSL